MILGETTVTSANSSITSVDQQTLSQAVVHQMRSVDIFALKGSIVCNVVFKALIWVITHLCHDTKNISTNLSLSSLSTLLHPSFHPRLFSSKFILNYLISAIIIGQFSACESLRCWGSHMTLLECFGLWIGLQLIHISSCSSFLTKPEGPRATSKPDRIHRGHSWQEKWNGRRISSLIYKWPNAPACQHLR